MQRKSFFKLFLTGLGYMLLGNFMSTIMTAALAFMIDNSIVQVVIFILTLFIFYSLVFLAGYKDGTRERLMVKNKRIEGPIKGRWIRIGLCLWAVMCIPSIILLFDKLYALFDGYIITYRIICGTVYPLLLAIGINTSSLDIMPIYIPFVAIAVYAFIPFATHLGYKFGYEDKFNPDKIMYENK